MPPSQRKGFGRVGEVEVLGEQQVRPFGLLPEREVHRGCGNQVGLRQSVAAVAVGVGDQPARPRADLGNVVGCRRHQAAPGHLERQVRQLRKDQVESLPQGAYVPRFGFKAPGGQPGSERKSRACPREQDAPVRGGPERVDHGPLVPDTFAAPPAEIGPLPVRQGCGDGAVGRYRLHLRRARAFLHRPGVARQYHAACLEPAPWRDDLAAFGERSNAGGGGALMDFHAMVHQPGGQTHSQLGRVHQAAALGVASRQYRRGDPFPYRLPVQGFQAHAQAFRGGDVPGDAPIETRVRRDHQQVAFVQVAVDSEFLDALDDLERVVVPGPGQRARLFPPRSGAARRNRSSRGAM